MGMGERESNSYCVGDMDHSLHRKQSKEEY